MKYTIGKSYPVVPPKDPSGSLEYAFEWGYTGNSWLRENEFINNSNWTIFPSNSLVQETSNIQDNKTVIILSGGYSGLRYKVTNTITTSTGRKTSRSFYIDIMEM